MALKGEREIEERVPYFALNLELNFRVLIRPYSPCHLHSLLKDVKIDQNHQESERKRT